MSIPFHTLIRIVPRDCSYDEERIPLHPLNVYDAIPKWMEEMERVHREKKTHNRWFVGLFPNSQTKSYECLIVIERMRTWSSLYCLSSAICLILYLSILISISTCSCNWTRVNSVFITPDSFTTSSSCCSRICLFWRTMESHSRSSYVDFCSLLMPDFHSLRNELAALTFELLDSHHLQSW